MPDDRKNVCDIISEMLDNPDACGLYETGVAYDKLVDLIKTARLEALGWMHAEACTTLDEGDDPRKVDIAEMLARATQALTR